MKKKPDVCKADKLHSPKYFSKHPGEDSKIKSQLFNLDAAQASLYRGKAGKGGFISGL